MNLLIKLIGVSIVFQITPLFSHSGGTIKTGKLKGCHKDRKRDEFHCHSKSTMNGQIFKSKEEALGVSSSQSPTTTKTIPLLKYVRKEWNHWIDEDSDCKNTRHEILEKRSLTPVTFAKANSCLVQLGKWNDFYYKEILTSASQIDIDHVVPLKHAFDTGGSSWDKKMREAFANDSENLVITNLKYNRQKGAQTITTWLPINKEYACKYVSKWFTIKKKYKLQISQEEIQTQKVLNCP